MMRGARSTFHTGVLILVAGVVGACDNTAGLESIEDLALRDMALVAADETLEIVNTWGQPYSFGGAPAATAAMPGIGGFGQPGGRLGLGAEGSGTVSETFYDENGVEQADYDELTTERIDVEVIVEGEVARDDWSASVYRERQMTITGLLGEETHRTHNGTGSMETHGSHHTDDGDREYDMTGSVTYTDVVIPIPGSDPQYPVAGTISREMTGTRTDSEGTETREMTMTITFDGDETAIAVVTGEEYELDLSTQEGRRPWRGRFGG